MKSLKFSIFNLQQTNHIILHEFQFLFEFKNGKKIFKIQICSNPFLVIKFTMFCASLELHLRIGSICKYVHSVWFLIMLWYLTMCIIDEHVLFTKICLKYVFVQKKKKTKFYFCKSTLHFSPIIKCIADKQIHFQSGFNKNGIEGTRHIASTSSVNELRILCGKYIAHN